MNDIAISLPAEAATQALGAALAPLLRAGDAVALTGPLGAGKTTLARAIIAATTGATEAASPTFSIVETYSSPAFDIWHYDLYRLEVPEEVWEAGLEEALDNVALIEWPERIESFLPDSLLVVSMVLDGPGRGRRAILRARGAIANRLAALDIDAIATA